MPPLTLAVLLLLLAAGPGAAALTSDAVHDLLVNYGLPPGLLPDAVTNYSLSDTGELEIDLARPCYVQFDELVHYDRHIRGQLTYGAISELTGIQRKKLLIWMSITGIVARVDVGTVEFQMGFLAEVVHAEIFEKVQVCRASSAGVNRELGLLPVAEA